MELPIVCSSIPDIAIVSDTFVKYSSRSDARNSMYMSAPEIVQLQLLRLAEAAIVVAGSFVGYPSFACP